MTEEGTIPGKKNREAIPEMLVRIVRRHRRPRNDMRVTGLRAKPALVPPKGGKVYGWA